MKTFFKLPFWVVLFFLFIFYSSSKENSENYQNRGQILCQNFISDTSEKEIDSLQEQDLDLEELIETFKSLLQESESDEDDTLYFEVIKAFDILGAMFRELLKSYIIELSPLELLEYAADGITNQLDPYTNFFFNESDLSEAVSNNEYVGLGVVVSVVDSSLYVVDFLDSIAKEVSNLNVGDKLISIDNVKLAPNLDTLRKYTSGFENTKIEILVEREGLSNPVTIQTFRRKINVPDIPFSRVFDLDGGKVLYIKVDRFSVEMLHIVRERLQEFKNFKDKERKGIIIDLRDNPGGVLESAIQFCEMFLPSGLPICSTRGRDESEEEVYKAVIAPIDTTTPLVVIVNRGSASASEVVAGAIQDNDRGVIVGEQTFGKGIVQSVAALPHDSYLKITTSKYFTPSGRSIHRNRFLSNTTNKIGKLYTMDTVFYTKNGRIVKESKGIQPDIAFEINDENSFLDFLYSKILFVRFVSYLENTQPQIKLTDNPKFLVEAFISFLKSKNIVFKSDIEKEIDTLLAKVKKTKSNKVIEKKLLELKEAASESIETLVKKNQNEIIEAIRHEIQRRKVSFDEFKFITLKQDNFFKESIKILEDRKRYLKILGREG